MTGPITLVVNAVVWLPSVEYIASLSINAWLTLFSWNIVKLLSNACINWTDPLCGSIVLVMSCPVEKTFVSFIFVLELNIPEYIKACPLNLALGSSSTK